MPHPPANGKTALITGITGQDGSYLAELLLAKGYVVWGIVRRTSSFNTSRIDHLYQDPHEADIRLRLTFGDLSDGASLRRILHQVRPDEVYNLAAQSHVKVSFDVPEYTGDITALGAVRLLEAIRELELPAKFYQASSSEMFGKAVDSPQTEATPFYPRSPYAAAKAYAFDMTRNYRESYGMFAVNGIMFNHESPRRGETFVTRKISRGVARIKHGIDDKLFLGNLDARRDWGFAGDYVDAMWMIMQAAEPDDFVIATGETRSVRQFCSDCFEDAGIPIEWSGHGLAEVGRDAAGRTLVEIDPRYFRPAEVDVLCGDASKAQRVLGWTPQIAVRELARMMVEHDLRQAASDVTH